MAVISDKLFKDMLTKFTENQNYIYDDTVDNLLGAGKWSKTDLKDTITKFKNSNIEAESYYNESDNGTRYKGRLWIKLYNSSLKTTDETNQEENKPIRYFKNSIFYVYEYKGRVEELPSWITESRLIIPTNKPDGEFKLVVGEDDWHLIQENDWIVYDTNKERFTIYDSGREVKRLYISEQDIKEGK